MKTENYKFEAYMKTGIYKFKKRKFFNAYIKTEKIIKFGDTETEKQKFNQHKETILTKKIRY